jgi:hypothetical protein
MQSRKLRIQSFAGLGVSFHILSEVVVSGALLPLEGLVKAVSFAGFVGWKKRKCDEVVCT